MELESNDKGRDGKEVMVKRGKYSWNGTTNGGKGRRRMVKGGKCRDGM